MIEEATQGGRWPRWNSRGGLLLAEEGYRQQYPELRDEATVAGLYISVILTTLDAADGTGDGKSFQLGGVAPEYFMEQVCEWSAITRVLNQRSNPSYTNIKFLTPVFI